MTAKKSGLVLCLGLLFTLAACGEFTPNGPNYYTPLINEVYTNSSSGQLQWVEIYNNDIQNNAVQPIDLTGWTLNTSQGTVKLKGAMDKDHQYLIITSSPSALQSTFPNELKGNTNRTLGGIVDGSTALGNLDPQNDVIVLKDNLGAVIDQVGWGKPGQDALDKAGVTGTVNLNLPAPADVAKTLGRTPPGTVRDGVAPNNPGHFTIHDTVSPGGPIRADVSKYTFVLSTGSDVITGVGGILLWLAFVMVALIARRFQVLAEQKTYWELLLVAPIGIFIYDIILVFAYTTNNGSLENWQKWLSFPILFLSGIFCLWVINIFRLIAKNILEAE